MDGNQTYRVLRLAVENYKRLKAADVTPPRNAVIVAGKNRAGKSSLLDSIASVLGGKKQTADVPIHEGAESGQIICVLGDTDPQLLVKRVFQPDGKTALEITSAEGYKAPTPQAILDGLCGAIAFDPHSFTRMDDRKQLETLRELVGLDFSGLDLERKRLYDERTEANRDAKSLSTQAAALTIPDGTPEEPVSVMALMMEQKRRQDHNAANAKERQKVDSLSIARDRAVAAEHDCLERVKELEEKLKQARVDLESATAALDQAALMLKAQGDTAAALEDQDVDEVQQSILNAQATNEAVAKRKRKAELVLTAKKSHADSQQFTEEIEAIDAEKQRLLSEVAWPVEGLSFGESGVLYNGLPFSQASSAEQLAVSFAMSAAMNPRLKVALIRDASLLDEDQMKIVSDLAEKYDTQVWLEVVDASAGPCGILIEDGTVVAGGTESPEPIQKPKRARKPRKEREPSDTIADALVDDALDQMDLPFME